MKAIIGLAVTLGMCAAFGAAFQSTTASAAPPDCTLPAPELCPGKDCPVECKGGSCPEPPPDPDCRDDTAAAAAAETAHGDNFDSIVEPQTAAAAAAETAHSDNFDSIVEPQDENPVDEVEPTEDVNNAGSDIES